MQGPFTVGFQTPSPEVLWADPDKWNEWLVNLLTINHCHLNARHSEVGNLKLDADGWSPLSIFVFHTGKTKVSSHQVLFSSLSNKQTKQSCQWGFKTSRPKYRPPPPPKLVCHTLVSNSLQRTPVKITHKNNTDNSSNNACLQLYVLHGWVGWGRISTA